MNSVNVEAELDRIDKLERGGDWIEAIAALSSLNRKQGDFQLERRIAELRIEAFKRIEWPASKAEWPPALEDPFEQLQGSGSIPEIAVEQLSARTLGGGIQHHGSLIVRNLVAQEYIQPLKDGIDLAMVGREQGISGMPPEKTAPWYAPPKSLKDHLVGAGR